MYKTSELKFKEHVSYTEMMAIAIQYTKNVMNAALDEGCVSCDFMRVSAILYAFVDIRENLIVADDLMETVYSLGFNNYIDYIRDHTPMGAEFFDAFIRMLDRADRVADKRQPIDALIDSVIRATDNLNAFIQQNENGHSELNALIAGLRDIANNEGAVAPAK